MDEKLNIPRLRRVVEVVVLLRGGKDAEKFLEELEAVLLDHDRRGDLLGLLHAWLSGGILHLLRVVAELCGVFERGVVEKISERAELNSALLGDVNWRRRCERSGADRRVRVLEKIHEVARRIGSSALFTQKIHEVAERNGLLLFLLLLLRCYRRRRGAGLCDRDHALVIRLFIFVEEITELRELLRAVRGAEALHAGETRAATRKRRGRGGR